MRRVDVGTSRASFLVFLAAWATLGIACSSTSSPVAPTPTSGASTPPASSPPQASEPPPSPSTPPPAAMTARYRLTFEALWSAASHPRDFPDNPHFSPLVGATHTPAVRFWGEGVLATEGIRNMAELGRTSPLDSEIRTAIASGTAQFLLLGGGIARSPGSVSLEFEASQSHPLVTLVSMVAPSPDWFTGVAGLPLVENGQWVERRVLELGPWDAGTDSGVSYSSPDQVTVPRQPIARITGLPFAVGGQVAPVARFTFERLP